MSYDKLTHGVKVSWFKRGGIYLANFNRVSNLPSDFDKYSISKIGSISACRPVLLVREPEEWDKYKTCAVIQTTTQDVPKLVIEKGHILGAVEATVTHSTFAFKVHDIRTISCDMLYRNIAQVPDHLMNLILLMCDAFNTVRATNVVYILQELKTALKAYPMYANDIKQVYLHAYHRFPEIVGMVDPSLIPDTETFGELLRQEISAVDVDIHDVHFDDNEEKVSEPVAEPQEEHLEESSDENVENNKQDEKEEITIFQPSDESRGFETVPVIRQEISAVDVDVIAMYAAGWINSDSAMKVLKISNGTIKRRKDEYLQSLVNGSADRYRLNDKMYNLFKSWKDSRKLSGTFTDELLEAVFPIIAENIIEQLPEKVDFKDVPTQLLKEAFNVERYGDIPNTVRSLWYRLTAAEVYEVIPAVPFRKLCKVLKIRGDLCHIIRNMCSMAKDIVTNELDVATYSNTDTLEDGSGTEVPLSKEEQASIHRASVQKIKYWLTPRNIKNMPPQIRDIFLTVPSKYIVEVIDTMQGWNKDAFGIEYNTAKKYYEAQKQAEQIREARESSVG